MADVAVAAVDGITGPGRRVTLVVGDVTEISFKIKKKVIEITNLRGEIGTYDLAQVNSIMVNSDGVDFNLAVTSKTDEEIENARSKAVPNSGDARVQTATDPITGKTTVTGTGKDPIPSRVGTTGSIAKS